MTFTETKLTGVFLLTPRIFNDTRGWFMETFNQHTAAQLHCTFVQDNHSYSAEKGTLRGIHFQHPPMAQAKLVRCVRGAVLDVAVDLRIDSGTYKHWISVVLSEENRHQLFIPRGFGHGFITLTDHAEIVYKADNYYSPAHDACVRWCDPEIGVDWGVDLNINAPVLSEKDRFAPLLKDVKL